jgi:uncharacterized protein (TIGR00661 family)
MKILYGVPGEGMGHATRSKVVIDYLISKGHEVKIVASDRAFKFLDKSFPGCAIEIKGFHFAYKNAEVSKSGTFMLILKSAAKNLAFNKTQKQLLEHNFKPELVISDFESFSFVYAKLHKLPIISIDNMQVMDRYKLDIKIAKEERTNYLLAKGIVKFKVPRCHHYFITSFFDAKIRKRNTTLVPPIIRKEIQEAKIIRGKHIIMYQTSSTLKTVKETLHQFPLEKFLVYGMNKDEQDKNITFKPFSETGFIKDLASAKAVIANGGFSFISEAVYLKKPVYSFPINKQFEQWMNAAYIDKLGYGKHCNSLNASDLKAFLEDIDAYERNLMQYKQDGNYVLFEALDKYINSIFKG